MNRSGVGEDSAQANRQPEEEDQTPPTSPGLVGRACGCGTLPEISYGP
ncbi:hypothetical protein [Deinococcus alpinitundrae]|nr:hypothetical protein [Deinococcus alpinitundrae]